MADDKSLEDMIGDIFSQITGQDVEMYDNNESIFNSSLYKSVSQEEHFKQNKNRLENNYGLKLGVVVEVLDIDNKKNTNKKFPEYTVLSVEQDENNIFSVRYYNNCLNIDGFGGLADFFEYKLRSDATKKTTPNRLDVDFSKQKANVVLLLCQDGVTDKAIILKSLSHRARKTTLTPENGMHLEGEYNGVNWQINKDGEFTLTFKSATTNDGEYRSPSPSGAGGTFLKMDQEGSVEINSADPTESFKMRLDKNSDDGGLIEMVTDNVSITAGNDTKIKAKGGIVSLSGKNYELKTDIKDPSGTATVKAYSWLAEITDKFEVDSIKSVSIKSGAEMKIDSGAKLDIKSGALMDIDCGAILNIKGKTINIESNALVNIKGTAILVGGEGGLPAVTPNTVFFGIGNLGAPVLCNAVGPFSSTVLIKA